MWPKMKSTAFNRENRAPSVKVTDYLGAADKTRH